MSIKQAATDNAKEIAEQVISSPSAQKIVAGASVGQAIYGFTVDDISVMFSLTAGLLGIVLTSLMIVRTYLQIKSELSK